MSNLESLEKKLEKKLEELSNYVSDKSNNYMSEAANQMRREIYELRRTIDNLKNNERELELKEAVDILIYLTKSNLANIYKCAIKKVLSKVEKGE